MAVEDRLRHHEGVSASAEMSCIFELFGKEVTGVNNTRNVSNFCDATLMAFANVVFAEIDVFGALVRTRCSPVDGGLIVVVNCDAFVRILHVQILCSVDDAVKLCCAFVCGNNFSDAGAESRLILADGFPSQWPPCPADKEARHATQLEWFEGSAVWDGITNLASPAGITEGCKFVTISRCRWSCVGIGLSVVVVGEMVEGLDGVAGIGVERNAVISCAVQVFHCVQGRFVMLVGGSMAVRC